MVVDGRDNGVRFAELNGDGRTDMVIGAYVNGSNALRAWLNGPSGWGNPDPVWAPPVTFVGVAGNGRWWDTGVRFMDVNGDGRSDILQASAYYGVFKNEVRLNNGHGWDSPTTTWTMPDATWCFSKVNEDVHTHQEWFHDNGVQLVDVNGDGLPDLVQAMDSDGGTDYRRVRLNTGSGWAASDAPAATHGEARSRFEQLLGLMSPRALGRFAGSVVVVVGSRSTMPEYAPT